MAEILSKGLFGGLVLYFVLSSLWQARGLRREEEFSVAGRNLGGTAVAWAIIATLVGGASTIGTVQMAYRAGWAAMYFTLGAGLSCFFLGLIFARPLREAEVVTVAEFLGRHFGAAFRSWASLLVSLGMFVHVVAQLLASMAILETVFSMGADLALLLSTVLLALFVASGGMKGAAWLGKGKFFLLYGIMLVAAALALFRGGGLAPLIDLVAKSGGRLGFFGYGLRSGLVDLLSVVIGVLSTQTYLQALFSARDVRAARNGAFLSALAIPPVGFLGVIVGLHLRIAVPGMSSTAQALPIFLRQSLPAPVAALFTAGLLIVVLGTGAGLALGVTTNLYKDLLEKKGRPGNDEGGLSRMRWTSFAVLSVAAAVVALGLESAILKWSYLSMGLRGAAILLPLTVAIFMPTLARHGWIRVLLALLPLAYVCLRLVH